MFPSPAPLTDMYNNIIKVLYFVADGDNRQYTALSMCTSYFVAN